MRSWSLYIFELKIISLRRTQAIGGNHGNTPKRVFQVFAFGETEFEKRQCATTMRSLHNLSEQSKDKMIALSSIRFRDTGPPTQATGPTRSGAGVGVLS